MTEEHILSFKPAAGLDQIGNECCERVQDRKHRSQRCDDSALSCESRPDGIFGRDSVISNANSGESRLDANEQRSPAEQWRALAGSTEPNGKAGRGIADRG